MSEPTNNQEPAQSVIVGKCDDLIFFKFLIAARDMSGNSDIMDKVFCAKTPDNTLVLVACDRKRIHLLFNVWSWGFTPNTQYIATAGEGKVSFVPVPVVERDYPDCMQLWQTENAKSQSRFDIVADVPPASFVSRVAYQLGRIGAPHVAGEYLVPLAKLKEHIDVCTADESAAFVIFKGETPRLEFAAVIGKSNYSKESE